MITISRSSGTRGHVPVSYSAAAGTAVDGVDFSAVSGVLAFADGQSAATFSVLVSPVAGRGVHYKTVSLSLSVLEGSAYTAEGSTTSAELRIYDYLAPSEGASSTATSP